MPRSNVDLYHFYKFNRFFIFKQRTLKIRIYDIIIRPLQTVSVQTILRYPTTGHKMKFYSVQQILNSDKSLEQEFKAAEPTGTMRIGTKHLFFRVGLKHYAIPFTEITGCFRRVRAVETRLCCGRGTMEMESIVVRTEEGEAAEISVPGRKAAVKLMEQLKQALPDADFAAPARRDEG